MVGHPVNSTITQISGRKSFKGEGRLDSTKYNKTIKMITYFKELFNSPQLDEVITDKI